MEATLDTAEAAGREWPVVVVGAGPAGAFAAYELARAGVQSLLIDRQRFPRPKVCGGCLNARTLALLASAGLGELPASLGGEPLDHFELWTRGRTVRLPMPRGIAVSRAAFDEALVRAAIAAGAEFLPSTRAVLGTAGSKTRQVRIPQAKSQVEARLVIAADGLGGSFLPSDSGHRSRPVSESRIGAGAVLDSIDCIRSRNSKHSSYQRGVIHMAVGRSGYVGVVRVEGGRLSVAAALDRRVLGDGRTLAGAITELLAEAGLPGLPELGTCASQWQGTAALSRRASQVAFDRVFLIGDAAGYVEPFTGEGISWALEAAREVSALVARAALAPKPERRWDESLELGWRRRYQRRIARRQRWCRGISWALRRQTLVASAARLLGSAPSLAAPLMAHLNAMPGERTS